MANKKEPVKHPLKDVFVAVDLGATEFRGVVGKLDENNPGKVRVLAMETVAGKGIKRGCIQNVYEVNGCINKLCKGLQNRLDQKNNAGKTDKRDRIKTTITKVYVALNGISIDTESNRVSRKMGGNTVTSELLEEFMVENRRFAIASDNTFLDIVPQEAIIDDEDTYGNLVGTRCEAITAKYKLIVGKKSLLDNLKDCLNENKLELAGYTIAPVAAGDAILGPNEKELGCVLVDMGDTSTGVSIYWKGLLRFTFVIPLGSSLVNKDLAALKVTETVADKLKLIGGCNEVSVEDNYEIELPNDRLVDLKTVHEIIRLRWEEIFDFVGQCIEKSGLKVGGQLENLILAGRASQQKELIPMVEAQLGLKTRIGRLDSPKIYFDEDVENSNMMAGGEMNRLRFASVLGTLLNAKESCLEYVYEEEPAASLFDRIRNVRKGVENIFIGDIPQRHENPDM